MKGTVLVTGGAGFIGRAAVQTLAANGWHVRVGTRQTPAEAGRQVEVTSCDLDRKASTQSAVSGTTLVVHAAYGDAERMLSQCRNLLEAMDQSGVERLIYLSSIAVYADSPNPDASLLPSPSLGDAYARGKVACEQLVRRWVNMGQGRQATILRPGIVYGRGSYFWIDKLVQRIKAGIWGNFGRQSEGWAALVHVDDVADCIGVAADRLFCSDCAPAAVEVVDLVGPETVTWNIYFERVAESSGSGPLQQVSATRLIWWRWAGFCAKAASKLGFNPGGRFVLAPGARELRQFRRKSRFDMERTARLLGWRPSIGLDEGLLRTFSPHETKPEP